MVAWGEVKQLGKEALAEFKADDVGLLASAVAFRIFLSIFPSLIAAVAIFGLVAEPGEIGRMLDSARGVLPGEALNLLGRTLEGITESKAGGAAIAGVAGGLWAASSAAVVLVKALNLAYEVDERRKLVKLRAVAFAITLVLLAGIATLLALVVLGRFLQGWLIPEALQGRGLEHLITAARIAASVVILMLLFALVYWLGPNRPVRSFRWITPGSVVGVVAWLALSGGFALYTHLFGNYNATYGSLAGAVVLMLWLQLSMTALLAGAELNQVWERRLAAGQGRPRTPVNAVRGTVTHPD